MGSSLSASPALRRHIDALFPSLDDLTAAAEAAQALLVSPGWPVLTRLLDAEVAVIDDGLDSGRVLESRSDYAWAHGRRGGLRAAPAFLEALEKRAAERLAEQRRKHEGAAEPALIGR